MVAAQIELGLGVIPRSVYGVVAFMAVATTVVAPPMLRLGYRKLRRSKPFEEYTIA